MRRYLAILTALVALTALAPASSQAAFGLKDLGFELEEQGGAPVTEAGIHPFAVTTKLAVNTESDPDLGLVPEGALKDLAIHFPPGLVGNPDAVLPCTNDDFTTLSGGGNVCPEETIIGKVELTVGFEEEEFYKVPLYNLEPAPGTAAKVGFVVLGVPVTIDVGLNPDPPHDLISVGTNVSQAIRFYGVEVSVWGNPGSAAHDEERGRCVATPEADSCPVDIPEVPFLTAPRSCSGPMEVLFEADSWQDPATRLSYPVQTSAGLEGCEELAFEPQVSAEPTTSSATSASGLRFNIDVEDEGLTSFEAGPAASDIKKAEVTLPEGFTVNPSYANGLETCTEADLARETATSEPGEGCPQASKAGEVEVETPLLEDELLQGEVFVATQDENPFGSLLALYMVIRDPELGIIIKQPGKVELDPVSGQIKTTFGEPGSEVPQVPFSHLRFRFSEGTKRAPLITPPACGTYEVKATFTPWADPSSPYSTTSDFEVTSGPGGSPCPSGPSFDPGFSAGSLQGTAGAFSPFAVRLTRNDTDQPLRSFSATLPPGVTGKITGIARCPDAAIAAAGARSGREEAALPSCPADSKLGTLLGGAGVGPELTWVPGSLYLAGPYNGHPLSIAAITPALAGPFDAGTVVVREGLDLDPESARALIDGSGSQIPTILKGIPLRLADLRINTDRPDFTLNPTSCEPSQTEAQIQGATISAARSSRYQASGCGALAFKPKLKINLKGSTTRSGHPELRSVLTARPGDANIGRAVVTLPPSEQIDNAHINNPCTRVQFAAEQCPPGSVLGIARAYTPLLEAPLEGPVYFRSNGGERELPDIVADLRGQFEIIVVGFVDSKKARLRTTFANVPDAPVSKFVLNLYGGKRGLLVNNRSLCAAPQRARIALRGQNGRPAVSDQVLRTSCKKKRGGGRRGRG